MVDIDGINCRCSRSSKSINFGALPPTNRNFLAYAFSGVTDTEMPWVTGFLGDPLSVDRALWGGRNALPLPWFIRPAHNNYIAVSSFLPAPDGMYHRRKNQFSRMHLVMVDDVGTKVPMGKLALPPSALVETSPGNYQAWYFLNPPEADRSRAERLIDRMVANGLTADASDPGMKGVTRYGRLPVGVNGKAKYVEKLGHAFVQRVKVWAPTQRYSVDEIASAYGADMTAPLDSCAPRRSRSRARFTPAGCALGSGDDFLDLLNAAGLYIEPVGSLDGAHHIVCPWLPHHTDEDPSGTVYFVPSAENDWYGGFKCHHGHCQHRSVGDLGYFLNRLQELSAEVQL
jgi:hypothetical protein